MFELCALLRSPKVAKPRKAAGPKIAAGTVVTVMGKDAVVVGKSATNPAWWDVDFGGKVYGFARSEITVKV